MKPWQLLVLVALAMNGLISAAFFFTGHIDLIQSEIAGALLPVVISTGLLFWAGQGQNYEVQQLQKMNIIGFFLKVILLGGWAVLLLKAGAVDKVTFIVILLINFLAWHGVEAYYWRLFMAGNDKS